jgi:GNAT superfamily N-acetyltransferase
VLVRDARTEDAPALARLLTQLGYPVDATTLARRLQRVRQSGDRVLVACVDEEPAGLAHLHVAAAIEHDGPAGKLGALVVDERHRRRGVGRALVDAIEAAARSAGCAQLFLTTAERRADAHAFYESVGFEQTGRRYTKRFALQQPLQADRETGRKRLEPFEREQDAGHERLT